LLAFLSTWHIYLAFAYELHRHMSEPRSCLLLKMVLC